YQALPGVRPPPQPLPPHALASDPLPDPEHDFTRPAQSMRRLWPAGEEVAQERLRVFADQHLADYHERRDFPALPGTSQQSPYLAAGVLSPRQCLD
ncbi:deoxyribodipyrimidine photo-lyase, partial [Pseudomonas aeruginosa]